MTIETAAGASQGIPPAGMAAASRANASSTSIRRASNSAGSRAKSVNDTINVSGYSAACATWTASPVTPAYTAASSRATSKASRS